MNTTQTGSSPTLANAVPLSFVPGAVALESAYLGQVLSFRVSEMWLYALEHGVKIQHDFFMNMLGYAPYQHLAPWDEMSRANNPWLEALDKGLAAAGE